MASRMTFHQLVVKMLGDTKFRNAVIRDPEKALTSIGANPTKKQIAALKGVDWNEVEKVMQAFSAGMHPDTIS